MRCEVLFPEVCHLCGDGMNIRYLCQSCEAAEVIETPLNARPAFLSGGVDLVYLGSATEDGLRRIVASLLPYRQEIEQRIDEGQWMLLTGNALDVLGEYVDCDDGWRLDGLGILPTHAEYHMMDRHNSFFLGTFEDGDFSTEIVGFKSLFGHTYGAGQEEPLFTLTRGVGRYPGCGVEGFRRNHLMATYLTGPLLILNPPFTGWLLRQLGCDGAPAFEEAAMENYRRRLEEFHDLHRDPLY